MGRKKVLAGNWKMNTSPEEGMALLQALKANLHPTDSLVVYVAPPHVQLQQTVKLLREKSNFYVAAQDARAEASGAFTGDVSISMLAAMAVDAVILGHSERRLHHQETDAVVNAKMHAAFAAGLIAIVCVGENLEVRQAGNHLGHVWEQLNASIQGLDSKHFNDIIIAYEPVWAIGTGEVASPEQAQAMHQHLRNQLASVYGSDAEEIPLLYGGSCKPSNANALFAQDDVDGGLIGGAALKVSDFHPLFESLKNA
mgnify:FL=1